MGIIWNWENLNICLRLTFIEILHKIFWVSWEMFFKGLGVQKDTQTPCWLRLWLPLLLLTPQGLVYLTHSCGRVPLDIVIWIYDTSRAWNWGVPGRGLAAYASSVSFGHAEHCFLTVWTPKSLCQNLLKMTFLRRWRSCSTCHFCNTLKAVSGLKKQNV